MVKIQKKKNAFQNPCYNKAEKTKQMEQILTFQVPAEGLELVILLHTQY